MRIYSEKTGKEYQTVEECLAAEKVYDTKVAAEKAKKEELAKQRKDRATEVEGAYKDMIDAQKNYNEKLKAFVNDYGSFHMTYKANDKFDWFNTLFNIL